LACIYLDGSASVIKENVMPTRSFIAALGLTALSLSLPALAYDPAATPDIDQRLYEQHRRIDQGLRSGRLTPGEAERLERWQAQIRRDLARARADGVVTGPERRQIQRELDRASAEIENQKRDLQHDYNHDGRTDRRYW
jgi:hypothetical protein